MASLAQQLSDLGSVLNIIGVPASVNPGDHVTASLAPLLSPLHYTDIVQQQVSVGLDIIAKEVIFKNDVITDSSIARDAPVLDFTKVPPVPDTTGTVPGFIGKITGTVPIPVAVPIDATPKLTITWELTDENDKPLAESADYIAPAGLTNPVLDVVFLPAFSRFEGVALDPAVRKIKAKVKLTAGTIEWPGQPAPNNEATIGPVTIRIPTLPFPKVLALTVDSDFQGPALIMVPGVSAITGVDHIRTLLQPIRDILGNLGAIAKFAEMLVGINTLSGILDATNIVFNKATQVENLNDITLVHRGFFENDTEGEDELSSFVYISPPPSSRGSADNSVEMFNDQNLNPGQGKFTVNTGTSFVALCANLHSANPVVSPSSAVLTVNNAPAGSVWFHGITTFGDELSSIRFL